MLSLKNYWKQSCSRSYHLCPCLGETGSTSAPPYRAAVKKVPFQNQE
jgi:hypothetical protein